MAQTVIKNPPWWNRRSGTERSFMLVSLIVIITCIILAVGIILVILHYTAKTPCQTTACLQTAATLLQHINEENEPCDDFYEFACGKFLEETIIPQDADEVSSFTKAENNFMLSLQSLLDEPEKADDIRSINLTKKFFKACINESSIEKQGLEPIRKIFSQIGGWPILEGQNWKIEKFDWKDAIYKLNNIGYYTNYLLSLYVDTDAKDTKSRKIHLLQATLDIKQEYLLEDVNSTILQEYFKYMVNIAELFGVNDNDQVKSDLMEIVNFSRKLAEISLKPNELRNLSSISNPYSVKELQSKYQSIPWLEFINNILAPVAKIKEDEIIVTQTAVFLKSFVNLINTTPKRTLANYIGWRVYRDSVEFLPNLMRQREKYFTKLLNEDSKMTMRWEHCVASTYKNLNAAVSSLFVRKHFDQESKKKITEIANNIREASKDLLISNQWMDQATKNYAFDKLCVMEGHIAYPDELLNDTIIDEYYKTIEVNENSYLESYLNINRFDINDMFSKLHQPVNRSDWTEHVDLARHSRYHLWENSISIPASNLMGNFFSKDRPNYMNYGAIGYIIGHEITHAFDDKGCNFDINGDIKRWCSPQSEKAFTSRWACFVKQYNDFTAPEINKNVNGLETVDENVADNGGMRIAYLAYTKWLEQNEAESKLPSLKYTPKQLFWISTAQMWCSKQRNDYLHKQINTEEHAPNRFRVIGPMKNIKEFAEDFECSRGSNMNPEKKCRVW